MKEWHCVLFGQPQGPFKEDQLKEMIGRGEIERDTLVWSGSTQADAARGWVRIEETELKALFAPVMSVPQEPETLSAPPPISFAPIADTPKEEVPVEAAAAPEEKSEPAPDADVDPDSYKMEPLPSAMFMQAGGAADATAAQAPQDAPAAQEPVPQAMSRTQAGPVLASRVMRFCGLVIEAIIWFLLLCLAVVPSLMPFMPGGARMQFAVSCVALLATLLYVGFSLYSLYRTGQCISKKMLGMKVVNADGSRAPLWKIVLFRNGVLFLLNMLGGLLYRTLPLGIVAVIPVYGVFLIDALLIFRKDRRTLHDLLAGTIVVKD